MTSPDSEPVKPQVVDVADDADDVGDDSESAVTEPSKLIRIASMTRAMLEEVRQTSLDEGGRKRLVDIHQTSLEQLRDVVSDDLRRELDEIFHPLSSESPPESELRIAQAQLVGWLEGLFHGIQATLMSQQMAAQAQLQQMRRKALEQGAEQSEAPGLYL